MAARNDITGKVIKTNSQTQSYRDGWERIFEKKTPEEWLKVWYDGKVNILDPDGWRHDNCPMDKPISRSEFFDRLNQSTISTIIGM